MKTSTTKSPEAKNFKGAVGLEPISRSPRPFSLLKEVHLTTRVNRSSCFLRETLRLNFAIRRSNALDKMVLVRQSCKTIVNQVLQRGKEKLFLSKPVFFRNSPRATAFPFLGSCAMTIAEYTFFFAIAPSFFPGAVGAVLSPLRALAVENKYSSTRRYATLPGICSCCSRDNNGLSPNTFPERMPQ